MYERSADGTLRLISPRGAGAFDALFAGASRDGSRVWFRTDEPNPGLGDDDTRLDLYERAADGGLRPISPFGIPAADASFAGASADGSRVWYVTVEPRLGLGDTDAKDDVYERSADGELRLISPPGTGDFNASFVGASQDGSRVWFVTSEPTPGLGDTDASPDLYERSADGGLRLISPPGSGAFSAYFDGASRDGSRVWFQTSEANPGLGDTDAARDVYERGADGTLRLISPPGSGAFEAFFVGASQDGSRVWFQTSEANPGLGDTDAARDVYERGADGTIRLISSPGAGDAFVASFVGASGDGSRVWFTTNEFNRDLGDLDNQLDVYERSADGALRLISPSGIPASDAFFAGASLDGSRVWFTTAEANPELGDTDAADDVFEARLLGRAGRAGTGPGGGGAGGGPPRLTRRVAVRGALVVGTRLRCDRGGIVGATRLTVTWRRGSRPRAAGTTYRVRRADLGRLISCQVLAANPAGSLTSRSAGRRIPRRCRVPALRGRTPARARELAGLAGCRVRLVRRVGAGVARGTVLGTTPPAGRSGPNGITVTIPVRR